MPSLFAQRARPGAFSVSLKRLRIIHGDRHVKSLPSRIPCRYEVRSLGWRFAWPGREGPGGRARGGVGLGGAAGQVQRWEVQKAEIERGVRAAEAKQDVVGMHSLLRHVEDGDGVLESMRGAGVDGDVVVAKDLDRF